MENLTEREKRLIRRGLFMLEDKYDGKEGISNAGILEEIDLLYKKVSKSLEN